MAEIALIAFILFIVIVVIYVFSRENMSALGYGRHDINNHRRVYFHGTSWCGACKLWKPIWEDAKIASRGSGIEFIEVDEDVAKTPYVAYFPSIYILTERGQRFQYKGPADIERFLQWIASPMLNAA